MIPTKTSGTGTVLGTSSRSASGCSAALERGIQVMAALREMRAASLHDLYLNTGIPKPTLTRILYTLYRQGLVWQRMADGAFLPSHIMLQRGRLDDIAWLVEIGRASCRERV